MLKLARKAGCKWGRTTCSRAAAGGNIAVLEFARAQGCPWDSQTCFFAVLKGHVEVLRWVRENGCLWSADTRDEAAAELGYTDDLGNLVDDYGNPF